VTILELELLNKLKLTEGINLKFVNFINFRCLEIPVYDKGYKDDPADIAF